MKELPVINTDRRGFLKTTCAALCTLPLAAIIAGCESDVTKVVEPTGKQIIININTEIALQSVGGALQKAFAGLNSGSQVNIIRNSETEFLVVTSVCTHQGGTVQLPEAPGGNMICALHRAEYSSKDGSVLGPPAPSALQRFESIFDAAKNTLTIKY